MADGDVFVPHNSNAPQQHQSPLSYEDLSVDSLKSASVEHGLQYNAIYWETGHKTYTSILSPLTQKFNWAIMDNQLRRWLGFHRPSSEQSFVFDGPNGYFRAFYGDPSVQTVASLKVRNNFSFYPTGTHDAFAAERRSARMTATDAFSEVFRSAFKVDYQHAIGDGSMRN
eukprot:GHVQ01015151.1.p2 GENE.GHVQ01015151.1~~GHVQ01015151.1.p2  ORF type:complete len:170 (+),score=17.38 GHVQ01015151.1:225-734(+)